MWAWSGKNTEVTLTQPFISADEETTSQDGEVACLLPPKHDKSLSLQTSHPGLLPHHAATPEPEEEQAHRGGGGPEKWGGAGREEKREGKRQQRANGVPARGNEEKLK